MFTSIIILLIPFAMVAVLPVAINTSFTSDELDEMGISLEDSGSPSASCPFQERNQILSKVTVACMTV